MPAEVFKVAWHELDGIECDGNPDEHHTPNNDVVPEVFSVSWDELNGVGWSGNPDFRHLNENAPLLDIMRRWKAYLRNHNLTPTLTPTLINRAHGVGNIFLHSLKIIPS